MWTETLAFDETTHNLPKERFWQVSKIPKIAPKITKNMYYSTGKLIFSETWAFDETTHNCWGLPNERFWQVSKIPKIAPKMTKTHVL